VTRLDTWLIALLATITAALLAATLLWLARQPDPTGYPVPSTRPQPSPTPAQEA
jgi:hypothetical protein